ncbi:MAG: 50S ribosomal protein L4 [Methanobacteriota archaeon]|nr:MAG: 50S ribosomal protein L4 [Euryarchaeota archaeon]
MADKVVKKKKTATKQRAPGKINVYGLDGSIAGEAELPEAFRADYRPDLIRRAVTAMEANARQPYAPKTNAGALHSVETWGKGRGVSRVQRLMNSSRGAQSPNNVGGRRAHPPKLAKDLTKKVNRKELAKAKLAALHATSVPDLVRSRGHRFDEELTVPIVVKDDFESIKTTREAIEALSSIGVYDDIERAKEGRSIRAGRGKMRGRRYRNPRGPLIVLSDDCEGGRSVRNLSGTEVVTPKALNVSVLAPGGDPGRLLVVSESALLELGRWRR